MRKKLFIFVLIGISCSLASMAQDKGVNAVRKFGDIVSDWCRDSEHDAELLNDAARLCPPKSGEPGRDCAVSDSLMYEFVRRSGRKPGKGFTYSIPYYMNGFQTEMDKGSGINVRLMNIRPATNIQFDEESLTDEKRNSLYFISCDVIVSGSMNYTSKDIFCVRKGDGLICHIGTRGELVNTTKIKDWDPIAAGEFNSIEFFYGYSKNFPLNVGLAANFSYFNIGLEYGQNFDKEPIITKQHTNFASSQINGKYFYLMASPGVFLRFATISYGLGATMTRYNYESVYDSSSENKTFFTMKPKVAFNLPLPVDFKARGEKCYLCPYVGYLFVPKFSKLNSLEFGIGLRFRFEN